MTHDILISDSAKKRIAELLVEEPPNTYFRIEILGGGCSGFQYKFDLDNSPLKEDEILIETEGAKIVIDKISLSMLQGAELDYSQELVGAAFTINNPNATSGCGCGNSFAI